MLERFRLRARKGVDPRQVALEQVLDQVKAGPQLVGLKHEMLDSQGVIVPPELHVDPETGEASLAYSLSLPLGPRQEDGTIPSTTLSVGVLQTEAGEHAIYVASDEQRVFQADPAEEGLADRIRTKLVHEVARRIEERRLPAGLVNRFTPIPEGSGG